MQDQLQVVPEKDWYPDRVYDLAIAIDQAMVMAMECHGEEFMQPQDSHQHPDDGIPVQILEDGSFIIGYGEIFLPIIGHVTQDLTWRRFPWAPHVWDHFNRTGRIV